MWIIVFVDFKMKKEQSKQYIFDWLVIGTIGWSEGLVKQF